VSNFLSRLAARAVGEPAAARPRVPGLFEEPTAAADATLEVIDEEIVAPRVPSAREDGIPEPSSASTALPPAPIRLAGRSMRAPGAEAAPSAPRPAHEITGSPPARLEPSGVTALDGKVRPVASAAVRVTPAAPAVAAAREPALSAPAAPTRHEEPVVRVHIGRLEVRANLQQHAPEQPRREAPRDEGPSLTDYLRGKREAG